MVVPKYDLIGLPTLIYNWLRKNCDKVKPGEPIHNNGWLFTSEGDFMYSSFITLQDMEYIENRFRSPVSTLSIFGDASVEKAHDWYETYLHIVNNIIHRVPHNVVTNMIMYNHSNGTISLTPMMNYRTDQGSVNLPRKFFEFNQQDVNSLIHKYPNAFGNQNPSQF